MAKGQVRLTAEDKEKMTAAKERLVLGGLLGKPIIECPVCGGVGMFDRLWAGNEELCAFCEGAGEVIDERDGRRSSVQQFSYTKWQEMVKR